MVFNSFDWVLPCWAHFAGGTFALYFLIYICRYAKVDLIPNQQAKDKELSNYQLQVPSHRLQRASTVKSRLENSKTAKYLLLLMAMLGTFVVIGDGILTPVISSRLDFLCFKVEWHNLLDIIITTIRHFGFFSAMMSVVWGIRTTAESLNNTVVMRISVLILVILVQV